MSGCQSRDVLNIVLLLYDNNNKKRKQVFVKSYCHFKNKHLHIFYSFKKKNKPPLLAFNYVTIIMSLQKCETIEIFSEAYI